MTRKHGTSQRINTLRKENATLRALLACRTSETEALRAEMLRDSLTGLYNRTGLRHAWDSMAARVTAVMVIDLDRFKQVNDRYGHHAGDIALCMIADMITECGIIGARTGGDEFIGLVTTTDPGSTAEQLQALVRNPVEINGNTIMLTVSIGLCLIDGDEPMSHHIERADSALYQVKRAGRDGVRVA